MPTKAQEELILGIKGYAVEQKMILDAIEQRGGTLTETEFDSIFGNFDMITDGEGNSVMQRRVPCPLEFMAVAPSAILLTPNGGRLGKFIHLLQLMVEAGLIEALKDSETGLMAYRRY